MYASEALAYAAGIFGVSLYFRHKIGEIDRRIKNLGDPRTPAEPTCEAQ